MANAMVNWGYKLRTFFIVRFELTQTSATTSVASTWLGCKKLKQSCSSQSLAASDPRDIGLSGERVSLGYDESVRLRPESTWTTFNVTWRLQSITAFCARPVFQVTTVYWKEQCITEAGWQLFITACSKYQMETLCYSRTCPPANRCTSGLVIILFAKPCTSYALPKISAQ